MSTEHVKTTGIGIDEDGASYPVERCSECGDRWPCKPALTADLAAVRAEMGNLVVQFKAEADTVRADRDAARRDCERLRDALDIALKWASPGGSNGDLPLSDEITEYEADMQNISSLRSAQQPASDPQP